MCSMTRATPNWRVRRRRGCGTSPRRRRAGWRRRIPPAATVAGHSAEARQPADTYADYLLKYGPYLPYDCYLAADHPIIAGVLEGSCRHSVRDRIELTGARWRLVGAEVVLKLWALRGSGDFDAYRHSNERRDEYTRSRAQRYADGIAPPPAPQARGPREPYATRPIIHACCRPTRTPLQPAPPVRRAASPPAALPLSVQLPSRSAPGVKHLIWRRLWNTMRRRTCSPRAHGLLLAFCPLYTILIHGAMPCLARCLLYPQGYLPFSACFSWPP